MPTFVVALMVVVLLVIALSVVLLLTRFLRREREAVVYAEDAPRGGKVHPTH